MVLQFDDIKVKYELAHPHGWLPIFDRDVKRIFNNTQWADYPYCALRMAFSEGSIGCQQFWGLLSVVLSDRPVQSCPWPEMMSGKWYTGCTADLLSALVDPVQPKPELGVGE